MRASAFNGQKWLAFHGFKGLMEPAAAAARPKKCYNVWTRKGNRTLKRGIESSKKSGKIGQKSSVFESKNTVFESILSVISTRNRRPTAPDEAQGQYEQEETRLAPSGGLNRPRPSWDPRDSPDNHLPAIDR
jgi:hypothetical protein